MAEEEAKVCTFTFKRARRAGGIRRKAEENKSSSDEETVVAKVEKKGPTSVLSARTVSIVGFE